MVVGFCRIGLVAVQEDAKHQLRDFLAVSSIEHCKLLLLRAMACRCAEKCEDAGIGAGLRQTKRKPAESRGQVRIKPVASGSCWPTVKTKCEQSTEPKRAEKGKTESKKNDIRVKRHPAANAKPRKVRHITDM